MTPDIYAIVTAYNEAERIGATLATLATAFPGVRLIVGDDGSGDATAQIARAAGARVVRSERMIGKGGAASLAAEAASAGGPRGGPSGRSGRSSCCATATSASPRRR